MTLNLASLCPIKREKIYFFLRFDRECESAKRLEGKDVK